MQYARIRELIEGKRLSEAESLLEEIPVNKRDGEWNFLMGFLSLKLGWFLNTQKYLQIACSMEPDNSEYRDMLNDFRSQSDKFYKKYNITRPRTDITGNELPDNSHIPKPFRIICDCFGDGCDMFDECC